MRLASGGRTVVGDGGETRCEAGFRGRLLVVQTLGGEFWQWRGPLKLQVLQVLHVL